MKQEEPATAVESTSVAAMRQSMDRTYRYIWRRGVLSIIAVHPVYEALLLLYENAKAERVVDLPLGVWRITFFWLRVTVKDNEIELSLHPWRWLEYLLNHTLPGTDVISVSLSAVKAVIFRFPGMSRDGRDATPAQQKRAFVLILSLWIYAFLVGAPYNLIICVGWALFRGVSTTVKSALRPIPALLAVLVVVFATGDSWRIFGQEPKWRFTALIIILLFASLVATAVNMQGIKGGWRSVIGYPSQGNEVFKSWAARTPAAGLCMLAPVPPLGAPASLNTGADMPPALQKARRLLALNVTILFGLTMTLNLVAIAFWIFLLFVAIGTVAISGAMTSGLLNNAPATVVTQFGLLGQQFVITRQLLLLSAVLGAVAALNFATSTLQDSENRATFVDHALTDLTRSLGALAYYLGAVVELLRELNDNGVLEKLKGIDASSISRLLEFPASQVPPVTTDTCGTSSSRAGRSSR